MSKETEAMREILAYYNEKRRTQSESRAFRSCHDLIESIEQAEKIRRSRKKWPRIRRLFN